ncbi:MAG: 2,3-bisphosphoglycerate-independent phosphoglycerate mutase [Bacteroidales bacterium]|nr:2,3-bisphosphoglycerate-independent phosphoglycerate mutase [Bacteroidales bacterium]
MNKKVLLMILDGWGEGNRDQSNVIFTQGAPHIDALRAQYPVSQLMACGEDVGLPDGQMGNSEVGHLNLGAGRVVYQDLVKVNRACREHRLLENPEIKAVYEYVKTSGKALHLMGLTSHGGVHSSLEHLYEFLAVAAQEGLEKVYVHCFMDGRDCDPKSGKGFIAELQEKCKATTGKIVSIVGRYYAMDRDKRWDRVKLAYDLLTQAEGEPFTDPVAAVQKSYDEGITDEFIKPMSARTADGQPIATIQADDAIIFYNFRNDRARELTHVLTQADMPEAGMHTLPLYYCCLTPYDDKFTGLHILFDKDNVQKTLGEAVSDAGKKQLRIAETEKYAHVTFFFSGGREAAFPGESRILINSPKVATYDLQPEMSAPEVAKALVAELDKQEQDLVILNFANGDMVGHTGVYEAIRTAVTTVDNCVEEVVTAARRNGYTVLITADHGNADYAVNPDGTPNTAHSLNPVPFIVVDDEIKAVKDGKLADIAPTILKLMGIAQPEEMTGEPLV